MENNNLDEIILEAQKVREISERCTKRIALMSFIFISTGIALAHLFRNINTEAEYITAVSLMSQIIAFSAALILSEQFLSIPEKFSGIHNYAIAAVMSAPIYVWLGCFLYSIAAILLNTAYSLLWGEAVTIACLGIGMVIYGFGSIEEALSLKIKDKTAVVGWGWYMVVFSLGLQIYISLIELKIISRVAV